jgi:hypothetical protein
MTFAKDRAAAFAVIELDNIWSSFVRNYYLSWFVGTKTKQSVPIRIAPGNPRQFRDAFVHAKRILFSHTRAGRTAREEPPWHEKRVLPALARGCGATNLAQIQAGLSIPATVFDFLHTVRNFYAHRCEETAKRLHRVARSLGVSPARTATRVVLAIPPGNSNTVLEDWIAEIAEATTILCS